MQKPITIFDVQLLGAHINIMVIWIIILCLNIYKVPLTLF